MANSCYVREDEPNEVMCAGWRQHQAARMRGHAAEGLGADTDDRTKCEDTQRVSTMRTVRWLSTMTT